MEGSSDTKDLLSKGNKISTSDSKVSIKTNLQKIESSSNTATKWVNAYGHLVSTATVVKDIFKLVDEWGNAKETIEIQKNQVKNEALKIDNNHKAIIEELRIKEANQKQIIEEDKLKRSEEIAKFDTNIKQREEDRLADIKKHDKTLDSKIIELDKNLESKKNELEYDSQKHKKTLDNNIKNREKDIKLAQDSNQASFNQVKVQFESEQLILEEKNRQELKVIHEKNKALKEENKQKLLEILHKKGNQLTDKIEAEYNKGNSKSMGFISLLQKLILLNNEEIQQLYSEKNGGGSKSTQD